MAKYSNSASIAVGSTQSGVILINERVPTGFIVKDTLITGSLVTFLVSNDGVTYYPLYDSSSTEVSLIVSSIPKAYSLNPEAFMGWNYVKVRLGTSASAKAQVTSDAGVEIVTDSM